MTKLETFIANTILFAGNVRNKFNSIIAVIGSLTNLTTTNKSSIVEAINEINAQFGTYLNQSDVIDVLTSTSTTKPLSANQGKVLKGFIDNINTLLTSDDTTLDELQEVVDFIKMNKTTLDNLTISNIAGLQTALNTLQTNIDNLTKADIGLADVENYGIATKAEAEAGTTNVKYSTPLRVTEQVDAMVGDDDPNATFLNGLN